MPERSYTNLYRVLYMSTIHMLFQSIANSIMGIMSQMTEQNNIWWAGPISTLIMFVFSGLAALYNAYIGKIKYRYTFFLGSTGYTLYCACTIAFVFVNSDSGLTLVVIACLINVISGGILSVLYISQFNYVSQCSKADNQSKYFGIALGISQSANIVGNLLSAFIVEPLGQKRYTIVMTILIFVISLGYLFIKDVKIDNRMKQYQGQERNSKQEMIESGEPKTQENPEDPEEKKKMVFSFMLQGVVIAAVFVFLALFISRIYKDDMSPLKLNSLTFKIFIIQGVGEFIGGLTFVYLAEKVSKKLFLLATNKVLTLSMLLLLASLYLKNVYILGAAAFLLGFVDCCSYSLNLAVVSEENWGKQGFSLFNVSQCAGVSISIPLVMFVGNQVFIGYVLVFQIVASFFLHLFRPKRDKQ